MKMKWTLTIMRNGFAHALICYYTEPSTYECIKETERVLEYFERDENINQDIRLVAYNYMKINGGRWGSNKEYEALKKDYNFVGVLVSTDAPKALFMSYLKMWAQSFVITNLMSILISITIKLG